MRESLILVMCLIVALTACAPAQIESTQPPIRVYYAGAENAQMGVKTALDLAQQSGAITLVMDPARAQALVLNGVIRPGIAPRVHDGAGVMLMLGPEIILQQVWDLMGTPVTIEHAAEAASLIARRIDRQRAARHRVDATNPNWEN